MLSALLATEIPHSWQVRCPKPAKSKTKMNSNAALTGSLMRTYDTIFQNSVWQFAANDSN